MVVDPILSDLAQGLAAARANERSLPLESRELTPEQAYDVQAETAALVGESIAAYKIGLTTPGARKAMAWDAPIVGRLGTSDLMQSPASLNAGGFQRFAEAELLFEIGEDFDAGDAPFSEADVAGKIAGLFAGIELCASRYEQEDVTIAELIADNSNADKLVVGDRLATGWDQRFAALPVTLVRNGHDPVSGSTSLVFDNPLKSVTWLANWLAARGEGLMRGQIVASGSCTGITELDGDEQLIAEFGDLGTASAIIAPKRR